MTVTLITGGARSGKSRIAEARALACPGRPIYIATAEAWDDEMAARIARHRDGRGPGWDLREVPLDLTAALAATEGGGPRLVDCLTLWLSNLLHAGRDWEAEAQGLTAALRRTQTPVFLVTNEVGSGIVPDNPLARRFRDAAGLLNQQVAEVAGEVILAVSGLPLRVK